MENTSKTAGKLKAQIKMFSNKIGRGLSKPKQKFLFGMMYGIQACKDIKLSNISRSLEEKIRLIKTENRLSRQMSQKDLTGEINKRIIKEGALRIGNDTVLAVDIGDISKEHSKSLEFLERVRDGSTGKIKKGYWTCEIVGADVEGEELIPLYSELYSAGAKGFKSENEQVEHAVEAVRDVLGGRGIYCIDRGGDRKKIIKPFLENGNRFVIRMVGTRDLWIGDKKRRALRIANNCHCWRTRELVIRKEGKLERRKISIGSKKVKLTFWDEPLWMVVIKGFGEKAMMLLTNTKSIRSKYDMEWILDTYLTRWKCEESYRFIKQSYNLEDVRVRSYIAIRNAVALIHAIFYFVSVELGKKVKLNILLRKLYEKAKRFFEIPDFKQYAIADGIHKVLFNYKSKNLANSDKNKCSNQLCFDFAITYE